MDNWFVGSLDVILDSVMQYGQYGKKETNQAGKNQKLSKRAREYLSVQSSRPILCAVKYKISSMI